MATEEKGRDLADHGNLTFSKKGQVFLLLKKRGYFSSLPINYHRNRAFVAVPHISQNEACF
jgi:hypothetical protein